MIWHKERDDIKEMKDMKMDALNYRLKASTYISTMALIWLFSALISYILQVTQTKSSIISLVVLLGNLATYILAFLAFRHENSADTLEYDKKNTLLKTLSVLVIPFFVIIILCSLCGNLIMTVLNNEILAETDEELIALGEYYMYKTKYVTDFISNIFHNLNLIGIFAVKIYIDGTKDVRMRNFSLVTFLAVGLHLLCAAAKYIILLASPDNTGSVFFSTLTNVSVYIAYFAVFLLFESRRVGLKKDLAAINKESGIT